MPICDPRSTIRYNHRSDNGRTGHVEHVDDRFFVIARRHAHPDTVGIGSTIELPIIVAEGADSRWLRSSIDKESRSVGSEPEVSCQIKRHISDIPRIESLGEARPGCATIGGYERTCIASGNDDATVRADRHRSDLDTAERCAELDQLRSQFWRTIQ